MAIYYATTTQNYAAFGLSILAIESTRDAAEKTAIAKIARRYGERNIYADTAHKNLVVRSETELRQRVGARRLEAMLVRYSEECTEERAIERATGPQLVYAP